MTIWLTTIGSAYDFRVTRNSNGDDPATNRNTGSAGALYDVTGVGSPGGLSFLRLLWSHRDREGTVGT